MTKGRHIRELQISIASLKSSSSGSSGTNSTPSGHAAAVLNSTRHPTGKLRVNGHSFFPIDGLEFSPLVAAQISPTAAR
jgi:hypothetical protein